MNSVQKLTQGQLPTVLSLFVELFKLLEHPLCLDFFTRVTLLVLFTLLRQIHARKSSEGERVVDVMNGEKKVIY